MNLPWYTAYVTLFITVFCGGKMVNTTLSFETLGRNHALLLHCSGLCVKSPSESVDHVSILPVVAADRIAVRSA